MVNTPPQLHSAGVQPIQGLTTDPFIYRVTYQDADNDPPGGAEGVSVGIVGPDGRPLAGSPFAMVPDDPGDTIYTDGAGYHYQTSLAAPGDYAFYLQASDGREAVRFPGAGNQAGPSVTAAVVEWELALQPSQDFGRVGAELRYAVAYRQVGNRPTTGVQVQVLLPPEFSFVGAEQGGTFDPGSRTLSWQLSGSVAPGAQGELGFTVWAVALPVDHLFHVSAQISSDQGAGPTARHDLRASSVALWSLAAVADPINPRRGQQVTCNLDFRVDVFRGGGWFSSSLLRRPWCKVQELSRDFPLNREDLMLDRGLSLGTWAVWRPRSRWSW